MRKPSAETENRTLKSKAKRDRVYMLSLIAEIRERRRFGGMLSNIAYNLAQLTPDEHLKAVLDECRKAWDGVRSVSL